MNLLGGLIGKRRFIDLLIATYVSFIIGISVSLALRLDLTTIIPVIILLPIVIAAIVGLISFTINTLVTRSVDGFDLKKRWDMVHHNIFPKILSLPRDAWGFFPLHIHEDAKRRVIKCSAVHRENLEFLKEGWPSIFKGSKLSEELLIKQFSRVEEMHHSSYRSLIHEKFLAKAKRKDLLESVEVLKMELTEIFGPIKMQTMKSRRWLSVTRYVAPGTVSVIVLFDVLPDIPNIHIFLEYSESPSRSWETCGKRVTLTWEKIVKTVKKKMKEQNVRISSKGSARTILLGSIINREHHLTIKSKGNIPDFCRELLNRGHK